MDNKEMLYEISLKYNTLKMYENTLEQMKENGVGNEESFSKIRKEKDTVEKELAELLDPKLATLFSNPKKDPSLDENKFIQEVKKRGEYKELYDIRKDFFDDVTKPTEYVDESKNEIKEAEYKKPTFAGIQEKISNSQWISRSNFIVKFPKDKVDIDEWRVSGFHYTLTKKSACGAYCSSNYRGDIYVTVNDFSDKKEDGTYNILSKTIDKLYAYKVNVIGSIYVDVINNNGDILYTLRFTNCVFNDAEPDSFTYDSTDLRRIGLHFTYDNIEVASPDEKFSIDDETTNKER